MADTGHGTELRCEFKLHGMLLDQEVVEVKCDSRFCGACPGVTVLHHFSTRTGELLGTDTYLTPNIIPKLKRTGDTR